MIGLKANIVFDFSIICKTGVSRSSRWRQLQCCKYAQMNQYRTIVGIVQFWSCYTPWILTVRDLDYSGQKIPLSLLMMLWIASPGHQQQLYQSHNTDHQPNDCLLNRLFRRRSKKTPKLCVIGLCAGNSPVTSEFPAQKASNAEKVSIWQRHHESSNNLQFYLAKIT